MRANPRGNRESVGEAAVLQFLAANPGSNDAQIKAGLPQYDAAEVQVYLDRLRSSGRIT